MKLEARLQGSESMCQIMLPSSVPFAMEACKYMGKEVVRLVIRPGRRR